MKKLTALDIKLATVLEEALEDKSVTFLLVRYQGHISEWSRERAQEWLDKLLPCDIVGKRDG